MAGEIPTSISNSALNSISEQSGVVLPPEPGMYVQTGNGFTKIIGQIAEFTRTGSKLVSGVTAGIKTHKANTQLPGPHAQTVVSPQPAFYFFPPKQEAAAGVNAGDFILIRLEEKPHRRQFEIAAAGLFRASAGITLTHQIQMLRSEPKPGVYLITPATELKRGEYALYLARGEGMAAYVYDFGVQGALSPQVPQLSEARPESDVASTEDSNANDRAGVSVTGPPDQTPTSHQFSPAASSAAAASAKPRVTASPGGVLGISGADWNRPGVQGVEVVEVADGSSAQLAGLHAGNVITAINGTTVRSTRQFRSILAQLEPGTRVRISYLYRNDLVWMPKQTVAILSKGD